MTEVLCVGHASFDLSVFVAGFPVENSKVETSHLLEAGGGPAANAAYLISAWGMSSAFAGIIGDDQYGQRIAAEFRQVGTNISLLQVHSGCSTPLSVILVNRLNGSRTIINRKTKRDALYLDQATLRKLSPKMLLFDGHELAAALAALEAFPDAISILDAGSWREGTAQLAGKVHYLAASERFALQACQQAHLHLEESQRSAVRELRDRYHNQVVITLGERGLIADDGHGFFHLDAFKAAAVDTTAAGDIFHGAFAYGISRKNGFKEALRLASMAAALSVSKEGGRPSIPSLNEVNEALAHVD